MTSNHPVPKKLISGVSLIGLASLLVSPIAQAYSIDQPHFEVAPMVILWAANDATGEAQVVMDFVTLDNDGTTSIDLIGGNAVDGRTANASGYGASRAAFSTTAAGTLLDLSGTIETVDTASPGTIADQSIRMVMYYTLYNDLKQDLSNGFGELQVEVTYTAYVA